MKDIHKLKSILLYNEDTGKFTWKIKPPRSKINVNDEAGCLDQKGYVKIQVQGVSYYGHRLAWAFIYDDWPSEEIDHVNCVKSDNRACNLRSANRSQNQANIPIRITNKLGIKGVSKVKGRNLFVAKIVVSGKREHLGYYKSTIEAGEAYRVAAEKYFGCFGRK